MVELERITIRNLRKSDVKEVVALAQQQEPTSGLWTVEKIRSHIELFPKGQLCILDGDTVVGWAASMITDIAGPTDKLTWDYLTQGGSLSSHDDNGDTLLGVEMIIAPEYAHLYLEGHIYDRRKKLARELNLSGVVIGSQLSNYREYEDKLDVEEYIVQVQQNRIEDELLSLQFDNGFSVRRVVPDYFGPDSGDDWVFVEWVNFSHRPKSKRIFRASQPVRICTVQYKMRPVKNFQQFADYCEYFVDVAAGYHTDFVLFPELLTLQLLSLMPGKPAGESARDLSEFTDEYIDLFTNLAVRYKANIIAGSHFIVEDDRLLNASYLFRRDGTSDRQEKIHITPSERAWWGVVGGNLPKVFQTDCGRISIQICYDIEFPELSRFAVDQGANIIFVPFCTDQQTGYHRVRNCAQARCIENQVYIALAGTVGNLPQVDNLDIQYAQSAILTPSDFQFARDGIAAECTPNAEMVVIHDVDIELLRQARLGGSTTNLRDRRNDLYEVVWKSIPGS